MVRQMKATQEEQNRIENIAQRVGKAFGYSAHAEITNFSQFKVKWLRTYDSIILSVSDYLCGAPDEVIEDILNVIFNRITEGSQVEYSDKTCAYLTDKKFATKNRRTFLSRNGIEPAKFMTFKGVPVHFYKKNLGDWVGGSSTLMKVIALNPLLKDEDCYVVEEAIKHEYNKIQKGLSTFHRAGETIECDTKALAGYTL